MILVVDLCWEKDSLSHPEFVLPIAEIVRAAGEKVCIRHFSEVSERDRIAASSIILCGTALKDHVFADHPELFSWIPGCGRPVLGICAGMQAIAKAFGGGTEPGCEIGMTEVRVTAEDPLFPGKDRFEAYELHTYAAVCPRSFWVIAESSGCIQAIRHRTLPIYGVMFHPEVRNEWVVEQFLMTGSSPGGAERSGIHPP
jgi:GMP synthase-like glutamine amidotransferase